MDLKINISNYEEYLLSAVDGELSGNEMAALELFLQQYPHIREELALLKSARLTPDTEIRFDARELLYKQSAINYESHLLNYIDNELHGPEKQALEQLIQQQPHLLQELNILQKTRLQPDLSLQFGNKTSLYRQNRRKVHPIWWWSSAAAVVAGVAILLLPALPGNQSEKSLQVAVNQPAVKASGTTVPQPANTPVADHQQETVTAAVTDRQQPQLAANTQQTEKQPSSNKKLPSGNQQIAAANVISTQKEATDNSNPGLTKLAQPVTTSGEVVQQLHDKINEQQEQVAAAVISNPVEKAPVLANATTTANNSNKVAEVVAAPVQGELVVSVSMNGDSKLLNGVANVARFFSKRKK
ncbi:hypothetical protein SAMN05518672_109184 [Chitinophaga sp. CF118]|uniref:hypothetical protein n=1 Tax=Chitinophaga sp. CF118 TaxID=1884367 RepID=UPI0008E27CB2|nr:hypothetical protein [Chitinophaga sp. CF118]SFE72179.1 hypothetical protein SAMN05518672_109184 [Chitinophaga sp. CF118]